jgi:hypothetical protein
VANATGAATFASVTLTVPRLNVSLNGSAISVTGPGVGSPSPYPDWFVPALVFVPALAAIAVLLVYRWWRTRRWNR